MIQLVAVSLAPLIALVLGEMLSDPPPPPEPPPPADAAGAAGPPAETVVTATTPLHGSRLPRDHVPANVQTVTGDAIAARHSLDLTDYMLDAMGSVSANQVQ